MRINHLVDSLDRSATLKVTALTKRLIKEGKDVVNFAAGEPDFDTPEFIKEAAVKAINLGFTKYTPSLGLPELRLAIAAKLSNENNLNVSPEQIIVTSGAKYAIFSTLLALLSLDDEVIIPAPYWVSYPEMIKLTSAKAVFIELNSSNGFKLTPETLAKTITAKTKVLILNYPCNPTGVSYTRKELEAIYALVSNKQIIVLSDEIYEALVYDGKKHISFGSLPKAEQQTVTINGFSKTFSMTGWRIGYLAAPLDIINAVSKFIDHTTSCPSSISQYAALEAINNKQWQVEVRKEFQKRRDLFWDGMSECDRIILLKPQGTFYMFCDIRPTGLSSLEFSTQLLEKYFVSCVPASSFGAEGFVRFSFATGLTQIEKGIARVNEFIKALE